MSIIDRSSDDEGHCDHLERGRGGYSWTCPLRTAKTHNGRHLPPLAEGDRTKEAVESVTGDVRDKAPESVREVPSDAKQLEGVLVRAVA